MNYGFTYDLAGRPIKTTVSKDSNLTHQLEYGYDAVGNLTSYVEKDGVGTVLGQITKPSTGEMYSPTDRLLGFDLKLNGETVTQKFDYTGSGLLTNVTVTDESTQEFKLVNNDRGNLLSQINPNGSHNQFVYNDAHQVTESRTVDANNTPKWSSRYQYDDDGRLTSVTSDTPGSPSTTYVYNNTTEKLNRLTKATISEQGNDHTFDYSYDPAGNILSMSMPSGQANTFTYDADNKMASGQSPNRGKGRNRCDDCELHL